MSTGSNIWTGESKSNWKSANVRAFDDIMSNTVLQPFCLTLDIYDIEIIRMIKKYPAGILGVSTTGFLADLV